jgi:hypothetical protein
MNTDKTKARKIYIDKLKDPSTTNREVSSAYKDYLKSLLKPKK